MSEKNETEGAFEEIIKRYKLVKRERQIYAIKQFFKLKRGAFGFFLLALFVILSILSPILAPNPHTFKHAPLSRPDWFKYFDPNAIGHDILIADNRFDNSSDISMAPLYEIPNIGDGIIYPYTSFIGWGTLSYNLYIDSNVGAKSLGGAAVLEIIDDTQYNLSSIPPGYAVAGFSFNIHWNYNSPPYRLYLWFARKMVIDLPPIYSKTLSIASGDIFNLSLNLGLETIYKFNISLTFKSEGKVSLLAESDINSISKNMSTTGSIILPARNTLNITIKNIGDAVVNLDLNVVVLADRILELKDNGMYLIATLWDNETKQPMTGQQLSDYMSNFGVSVYYGDIANEGIIQYSQMAIESAWINESYDKPTEEPTSAIAKEPFYKPLFKKGNIVIFRLLIKFRYFSEDIIKLRNLMTQPIRIKIMIDDLKLQVQDKYYGIMGTTDKGWDIAQMIISGLKISLFVGFVAAFINIAIGVVLGLVSGYMGGKVDEVIMRICDFFMSIPGFPLLLVLAFVFATMQVDVLIAVIIVLSIFGWAGMARTIRSQVLALKANIYVEAAKASGATSWYIIRKHILPGVWSLVLMYIMVGVVGNILAEAGLSFLGVLVPWWDSLGKMIQEASGITAATAGGGGLSMDRFHWLFFPGLVLMLISYSFYAISDAYDELINPKRRKRF